jgi:FkbM family methyltransferase
MTMPRERRMAKRHRSFARILGASVAAVARGATRLFGRGVGTRAAGYAASVIAPLLKVSTGRGDLRFWCASYWSAKRALGFLKQEPETLTWIDQNIRAGDHLWDVGANVGAYTLYACLDPAVTATSFEPVGSTFAILVRNLDLNGMGERAVPLCLALSDSNGIAPLYLSDAEAGSSMHAIGAPSNVQGVFASIGVQQTIAMRGDDVASQLKLKTPDHVKIDVDGHELQVLRGMGDLLDRVRTLWIEIEELSANAAAQSEIEALLARHGLTRAGRGGRNCLFIRNGPEG